MGHTATKLKDFVFPKKHRNIVLCGPNAAGKTTLLYKLKLPNEKITVMPTIGFNVESIEYNLQVFDARPLVRHYLPTCHAVAFMIDAHDDDWWDAEDFFSCVLHGLDDHNNPHVPLLIWVNKMDLPLKVQPHEVCERLKLEQLARSHPILVQPCVVLNDEGIKEGLGFLGAAIAGEIPFGLTLASTPQTSKLESTTPAIAPPTKPSPGGEVPNSDEVFLEAFEAGELPSFGPKEMMRLAFLQRRRGGTAQMTLQAAKLTGYVKHATRMHFWASRVFETPLESAETSLGFLAKHPDLFPEDADAQEALIAAAYSERIDTDPTWALVAQPPDWLRSDGKEADAAFLASVEDLMIEADELSSFRSLVRLAFTLLCQQDRKSAIKRLDTALQKLAEGWTTPAGESALRPFHETRQYVALQLAHLALTQCPELKKGSFSKLEERCPDLCDEDCIFKYYSEEVLQKGQRAFVPPDREPLPSVVKLPDQQQQAQLRSV
eukprot:s2045_g7.t2